MCLGIPARVVSVDATGEVAMAVVSGVVRPIGTGLLDDEARLAPGDWVLVHMGFALERITEAQAGQARGSLEMLGAEPVRSSVLAEDGAPPGWASW
jgi:hydrogenase expression/formation protein HypC